LLADALTRAGISRDDFYRWETADRGHVDLYHSQYLRACRILDIRPQALPTPKCAVFLFDGDHETYVDNLLDQWYRRGRRGAAFDPCAPILTVVYTRWCMAGARAALMVDHKRNKFSGSVVVDFMPGLRYELALDCSGEPAVAQLRRYVKLQDDKTWAPHPVLEFQFSGASMIWLEKILLGQRDRATRRVKDSGQKRAAEVQRLERAVRKALQQHHEPTTRPS
jgi:hypothetical protein